MRLGIASKLAPLVALGIGVAFYAMRETNDLPHRPSSPQREPSTEAGPIASPPLITGSAGPSIPPVPNSVAASSGKPDYLTLIQDDIDDAKNGNGAAMLRISEALRYCQSGYRVYFLRPGKRRTLDEVIAWAAISHVISTEELVDLHDRCASLMDSNTSTVGTADEWLDRAVETGETRAQLQKASRLLSDLALDAAKIPDRSPGTLRIDRSDSRFAKVRELISNASRKDAGKTLWTLAENQLLLTQDQDVSDKTRWALSLAACKRGYDCSQSAKWYQDYCHADMNCQPDETGADLIKRIAAQHQDIEYLSDRAIAKLNSSKIDDLLAGKLE